MHSELLYEFKLKGIKSGRQNDSQTNCMKIYLSKHTIVSYSQNKNNMSV